MCLPFPVLERERPVVEGPAEDGVLERGVVLDREEGVVCGGVGGGEAGVEVETLHGEVTTSAVHQAAAGVHDLQHWAWVTGMRWGTAQWAKWGGRGGGVT